MIPVPRNTAKGDTTVDFQLEGRQSWRQPVASNENHLIRDDVLKNISAASPAIAAVKALDILESELPRHRAEEYFFTATIRDVVSGKRVVRITITYNDSSMGE